MSDQPRRDSSPRGITHPYTRARPFLPELLDYICETLPHPEIVLRASNGQSQAPDRIPAVSCLEGSNGTSRYTSTNTYLRAPRADTGPADTTRIESPFSLLKLSYLCPFLFLSHRSRRSLHFADCHQVSDLQMRRVAVGTRAPVARDKRAAASSRQHNRRPRPLAVLLVHSAAPQAMGACVRVWQWLEYLGVSAGPKEV